MANFYGVVGFVTSVETVPGVWKPQVDERPYKGVVLQNIRRWEDSDKVNSDLVINNRISILADTYAYQNIPSIRYILWMGTKWKVSAAEINRPRIILNLGGVYNES